MRQFTAEHTEAILQEIKSKRQKMIECANIKGFTNEDTIRCSQELDELIYLYQISFQNSLKNSSESKWYWINTVLLVPKALTGVLPLFLLGN